MRVDAPWVAHIEGHLLVCLFILTAPSDTGWGCPQVSQLDPLAAEIGSRTQTPRITSLVAQAVLGAQSHTTTEVVSDVNLTARLLQDQDNYLFTGWYKKHFGYGATYTTVSMCRVCEMGVGRLCVLCGTFAERRSFRELLPIIRAVANCRGCLCVSNGSTSSTNSGVARVS